MSGHVASLYAKRAPFPDESMSGYLVRLVDANGQPPLKSLLALLEIHSGAAIGSAMDALASPEAMSSLATINGLEPDTFTDKLLVRSRAYEGGFIGSDGYTWPEPALAIERHQVCPQCLRESAYHRQQWSLYHAPICVVHGQALIDSCPHCGSALKLDRRAVFLCGGCGRDLRRIEAGPPVGERLAAFAARLQEMGTLSFGTAHYNEAIEPQDIYTLWALAGLPEPGEQLSAKRLYRTRVVPRDRRLAALQVLADAWTGGRLDSRRLRRSLSDRWRHLSAIPFPALIGDRLAAACREIDFDYELLPVLLRDEPFDDTYRTIREWGRHPPYLPSAEAAAAYLEVPLEAFAGLLRHPKLQTERLEDEGFDGDKILAMRDFVGSLLDPATVDQAVGVPGAAVLLECAGVIKPWKGFEQQSRRFPAHDLAEIFDRLFEAIRSSQDDAGSMSLASTLGEAAADQVASDLILMLNGGLSPVGWSAPYRLIGLRFDPKALSAARDASQQRGVTQIRAASGMPANPCIAASGDESVAECQRDDASFDRAEDTPAPPYTGRIERRESSYPVPKGLVWVDGIRLQGDSSWSLDALCLRGERIERHDMDLQAGLRTQLVDTDGRFYTRNITPDILIHVDDLRNAAPVLHPQELFRNSLPRLRTSDRHAVYLLPGDEKIYVPALLLIGMMFGGQNDIERVLLSDAGLTQFGKAEMNERQVELHLNRDQVPPTISDRLARLLAWGLVSDDARRSHASILDYAHQGRIDLKIPKVSLSCWASAIECDDEFLVTEFRSVDLKLPIPANEIVIRGVGRSKRIKSYAKRKKSPLSSSYVRTHDVSD